MIKILYVHGYNGKPNGGSFQKLSKYAGSVHFNGEEVEMHLGYWAESGDAELCIGCFAPEDELLGTKYKAEFLNHFKETYDIPGGHHISEEAAEKIMTEIAPMLIERFKTIEGPGHIVSNGLNEDEKMRIKFFES